MTNIYVHNNTLYISSNRTKTNTYFLCHRHFIFNSDPYRFRLRFVWFDIYLFSSFILYKRIFSSILLYTFYWDNFDELKIPITLSIIYIIGNPSKLYYIEILMYVMKYFAWLHHCYGNINMRKKMLQIQVENWLNFFLSGLQWLVYIFFISIYRRFHINYKGTVYVYMKITFINDDDILKNELSKFILCNCINIVSIFNYC